MSTKKYVFLNSALKKTDMHRTLGTPGYTPMPLDFPVSQLTNDQLVAEVRHYITIDQQKKEIREHREQRQRALKILHKNHEGKPNH